MPIPTTGDFRILVKRVAVINGQFQSGNNLGNCAADILPAMSNAAIATYLNANLGTNPTVNIRRTNAVFCDPTCFGVFPPAGLSGLSFWPATDEFIFNPGASEEIVDILTSAFPLGFICTALQLVWFGTALDSGAGNDLPEARMKYNGLTIKTFANPNLNNVVNESSATAVIPAGVFKGLLSALGGFGVEADIEANTVIVTSCGNFNSAQCAFAIRQIYVQGDYALWSQGLTLTPTSVTDGHDLRDTVFTLTDTENKLNQLDNLYANFIDENGELHTNVLITNIVTRTAGTMTFTLPEFTPLFGTLIIVGEGNGTEFSGTTNVGIISVIKVDGSGLYKLVQNQTFDKRYNRDTTPVIIDDIKIPNPTGRTGFF